MYIFFTGASLKIAKDLIRATGMKECWALFLEKSKGSVAKEKLLKEILGLNTCNLAQTLKEILADREIEAEDRQDLLDDYIMENLRLQDWSSFRDGAERMEKCQEIEGIWERLRPHFSRTREAQGFKPRLEAVRDVMRHLGIGVNVPFEEALLEFVEFQHKLFEGYFRGLLEPFSIPEEGLPVETNQPLETDASVKPPIAVELLAQVEPLVAVKPQVVTEPPVEAKLPVTALMKAPIGLPARIEPKALMKVQAPAETKAPDEIPWVEPAPVLKDKLEEKKSETPAPVPDPTDRLSQPHGMEDFPLQEGTEPEEEASLPEPLLLSEPVTPAESTPATEPLLAPGLLRETAPEKETAPLMDPAVQMEKTLPPKPLGFAYTVDPKKLAKVLEVLLAIDPTIDLKPIPPDRFPGHPPPKGPFPSEYGPTKNHDQANP